MKFRKRIDLFLEKILVFLLGILLIDVLWQVASRYFFASPSPFTDEMAGFLLIWVGILGAAYVTGKHEHLAIDLLLQKAGSSRKRVLLITIPVFICCFAMIVMVVGGFWLVYTRFALNVHSAAMELPLGFVYLIIPVSGLLISYYAIDDILISLRTKV